MLDITSQRETESWKSRTGATRPCLVSLFICLLSKELGRLCSTNYQFQSCISRLYTRENFEQDMQVFENGEIVRTPLDSVILSLKHMMNDNEVTSKLLEFIEPPEISTIDRSFESLHKSSFITSPNDQCEITYLGKANKVDFPLCFISELILT